MDGVTHGDAEPPAHEGVVVDYCRARDALQRAEAATRNVRAEQADAERTLGGLLTAAMVRHNTECLAVPTGSGV